MQVKIFIGLEVDLSMKHSHIIKHIPYITTSIPHDAPCWIRGGKATRMRRNMLTYKTWLMKNLIII